MPETNFSAQFNPVALVDAIIDLKPPVDVVAAVEALRYNPAKKIALVFPEKQEAFHDVFNLRLLQQISDILEKQFVLVTTDPLVVKLAHSLAISVVASVKSLTLATPKQQDPVVVAPATPKASPDKPLLSVASVQSSKEGQQSAKPKPSPKSDQITSTDARLLQSKAVFEVNRRPPEQNPPKLQRQERPVKPSNKEATLENQASPSDVSSRSKKPAKTVTTVKKSEASPPEQSATTTKTVKRAQTSSKPSLSESKKKRFFESTARSATSQVAPPPNFKPTGLRYKPAPAPKRSKVRSGRFMAAKNLLITASLLGGLIVAGFAVYHFSPNQATVIITTDTSRLRLSVQADLSMDNKTVNLADESLPLYMIPIERQLTMEVLSSGRAGGSKATGYLELIACNPNQQARTLPVGTVFRKDGRDFVNTQAIVVESPQIGEDCKNISFRIEAVDVGEEYNLGLGSFQLVDSQLGNYDIVSRLATTGGTTAANCVTAADLDIAQRNFDQLRNDTQVRTQALKQLTEQHKLIPLPETFQVAEAEIVEPQTCPQISNNQIQQVLVYYMGGIKAEDVKLLALPKLKTVADGLDIVDDGLSAATFEVYEQTASSNDIQATLQAPGRYNYYVIINITQATASTVLDKEAVLDEIVGQKIKQVAARLRKFKGIKSVEVSRQPEWAFWVGDLPKNKNDITLKID